MGFPLEHGFEATLIATRLCELLGIDDETAQHAYYACMLIYTGCTTDAQEGSEIFGGNQTANIVPALWGSRRESAAGIIRALPPGEAPALARKVEVARRLPRAIRANRAHQTALCEVAEMLSMRLGLPTEVHGLFPFLTERWDGNSPLKRATGDDIPLAMRIAVLARDAAFQREVGGVEHATKTIAERAGGAFDPDLASALIDQANDVFAPADAGQSAWAAVLAAEPGSPHSIEGEAIDRACAAMGDFADLIAPSLAGHSSGVAKLAVRAGTLTGLPEEHIEDLNRAALLHDIGRVAVSPRIWSKKGPLTYDETEQVRLHPYHTGRVLSPSPFLSRLGATASDHHERMNGSGYPRGVDASALSMSARLLAAADAFHSMIEPRPYRATLEASEAAGKLADLAGEGLFDADIARAVIQAAGEPLPHIERPAGLSQREAQVIGLVARALQTKQIARELDISPKTADTHIQNAYRKMGVSTRAAATLFAMEHGLVASGEFPMVD